MLLFIFCYLTGFGNKYPTITVAPFFLVFTGGHAFIAFREKGTGRESDMRVKHGMVDMRVKHGMVVSHMRPTRD